MAKKNKTAKRIIQKAKISFLSLCPRGMNQIQTIYKSEDGDKNVTLSTLIIGKMSEQGELLAVVYAPDMVDGEGDTASAEVIKEFAYDFAANGGGIDIRHNEENVPVEDAFIAESFIIQKDDPRFEGAKDYDGDDVNVTGGWGVVLKINNEDLRKQYREDGWGGISMGGLMQVEQVSEDRGILKEIKKILASFAKKSNKSENSEITMLSKEDKKEVAELVVRTMVEVTEKTKKETEKIATKGSDNTKKGMGYTAPVLKENATEVEIEQHLKNVRIFELSKEVITSDTTSLNNFLRIKKQIVDGTEKEVTTQAEKDQQKRPFNAFVTNQDTGDVASASKSNSDDDIGDAIISDIKKEQKEKK